jgi:putative ABC transport system permease protein
MHSQPPRWTDKLLRWFCEPRLHEEVQGDLHELYGKWVAERGVKRANRRYVLAVLGFIRPFALKQNPSLQPKPPYMAMLRNYLTIALRNLQKNRVHSCINLAGLAFTSAFCLLVYTFVRHELSFDRFHRKAPQIYRVEFAGMNLAESGTKSFLSNLTTPDNSRLVRLPPGLAPELKDNFPEITQRFRFREQKNLIIGVNGEKHVQEDSHLVDSNFFQLFSFRLVAGNPQTALNDPQSVVLSQATARQYFGDGNPIGQTIEVFREIESSLFTVSGIAENPPANSSIDYQILFPFDAKGLSRADEAPERSMRMLSTLSLIELDVNTNLPEFQAKVSAFARGYYADELTAMNRPADQFQINLTPLADTHLDTIPWGWPRMGKKLNLYVLGLITLLILVIASLNYVFLALTQASARLQEVGIRKVNGASRGQLILQFWAETFVLVAIAVGAGYLAAMALLPAFSQLLDSPMDAQLLHSLPVGMSALGLAVLLSVLTGIYPALLISRFNPTRLLQRNRTYRINPGLSRVMVVVQYALCLFLVISTVVMREQFRFITEKNLGFDQENVVVINLMENHSLSQGAVLLERFRRLAAAEPDILAVSGGDNMTGSSAIGFYSFRDQPLVINKLTGDYAFTDMLGLEIIRGRNISPLFPTDTLAPGSVVINERLAEILGNECPVGGPCSVLNNVTVVGIVKDSLYLTIRVH